MASSVLLQGKIAIITVSQMSLCYLVASDIVDRVQQVRKYTIPGVRPFISDRCTGGIGFATVKLFLQSNARGLVLVDLTISALENAVSTLSSDDRDKCELLAADVTSEDTAEAYAAKAIERWGRLDISVQNAGIASDRVSILETDIGLWERTMSVNALGGMSSVARQ